MLARLFHDIHGAVVVAMVAVGVVQTSVHQVVGVSAVGNGFVPAPGTMLMAFRMGRSFHRMAAVGVFSGDGNFVLIDMVFVGMVQMSVVQIVGVPVVLDGRVAAIGTVLVIVSGVGFAVAHRSIWGC